MTTRRLRQRLRGSGLRMRDHFYRHLARPLATFLPPEEEIEVQWFFNQLVEWEVEQGSSLESILASQPHSLSLAIRRELRTTHCNKGRLLYKAFRASHSGFGRTIDPLGWRPDP